MDALLPAFIIFSAQLVVIIGVATIAEALARVMDARLRFTYWRGVALACLALPLSAIVSPEALGSSVTFLAVPLPLRSAESVPVPPVLPVLSIQSVLSVLAVLPAAGSVVWGLLCAGALVRLARLGVGAIRLRQLRMGSRAAVLTPDLEAIRSELAPRAYIRVSCEIAQPAAFGLRHPIVLLPEGFFAMDPEAQRTVAYHELLHVARRDWPWIVIEELARALFWFHPAVWWLVERIQESREQLVDRLVIARIPSKRAYMAALLAFADSGRNPATLATAFLRRRHLRSRLRKLSKESVMSRRRLVWTAVVLVSVMAGAIATTVRALPLGSPIGGPVGDAVAQAPQQQVVDGQDPGVTLPKVISEVKPQYTPEAMKARIQGTGVLTAVIRTDGTPAEIKVTKSVDTEYGLDKQAVDAISQWRFEPGVKDGKPVPVRVEIEVRFRMK
jgi:TonB family protein